MNLDELPKKDWLDEKAIMVCYRGSISHGMYRPSSEPNSIDDVDLMSIVVPDVRYYFGLREWGSRGTHELMQDEWDVVAYEVRKYFRLLRKGNPNVLVTLWLSPSHYIKRTLSFDLIQLCRDMFVGKWVYRNFIGYAHGQLKRMQRHSFDGYMGEKRKALVEKYGYDPKNASHLIRLLRMGVEFMQYGMLWVDRTDIDAQELLDIKDGKWTLDEVKEAAEDLFACAEMAYKTSPLPEKQNAGAIEGLCIQTVQMELNRRGEI